MSGEVSGHFAFAENYYTDNAFLAMALVVETISQADKPLSELISEFKLYHRGDEVNLTVDDREAKLDLIRDYYNDNIVDEIDGITVEFDDWWFNVRPSNTEPLLRVTVEAGSEEELKKIQGFQFLSLKPMLVILNSDENNYGNNEELLRLMQEDYKVIEFAGKFEMELAGLDDEEARAFMEDLGIESSARDRLITFAYDMLGYISFFTVGEDEVRAWTITRGTPAVEAAGEIHSDLERGFIRAECFRYEELVEAGSEKGVKENGKFRLEGKNYIVQDGDILHIRFSA